MTPTLLHVHKPIRSITKVHYLNILYSPLKSSSPSTPPPTKPSQLSLHTVQAQAHPPPSCSAWRGQDAVILSTLCITQLVADLNAIALAKLSGRVRNEGVQHKIDRRVEIRRMFRSSALEVHGCDVRYNSGSLRKFRSTALERHRCETQHSVHCTRLRHLGTCYRATHPTPSEIPNNASQTPLHKSTIAELLTQFLP